MLVISGMPAIIEDPTVEFIIVWAIEITIAVFLMRYFTMEWNKEIGHSTSHHNSSPI